jgi:NAD(P)-dependent dehydrogenase (short-subunit alcohol dehydrogenase family)
MRRVLVTGANKGIGLATVRAVLEQHDDSAVLLGSRDTARGQAAIDDLCAAQPAWRARLSLLPIDVADDRSVHAAREAVDGELHGIVNNAGIGLGSLDLATVVNVNTLGPKRVCDAFLPLLATGGRVVNVSSASGPNFVGQCSPGRRAFFRDATATWEQIEALIREAIDSADDPARAEALGLGDLSAYGFSKACLTLYTMALAREHPDLCINACTPGYIETDLTRPTAAARGAAPAELGMKPPAAGTVTILFLLFGEPGGSGHYYGSDARRSPLDRYRAPGSPEYTGDW